RGPFIFGAELLAPCVGQLTAPRLRYPVIGQDRPTGGDVNGPRPQEGEHEERGPLPEAQAEIGKAVARLRRRRQQEPSPEAADHRDAADPEDTPPSPQRRRPPAGMLEPFNQAVNRRNERRDEVAHGPAPGKGGLHLRYDSRFILPQLATES